MNSPRTHRAKFYRRYEAALREHIDAKRAGDGDRPQGLGRSALETGLTVLDMAVIHERALVALSTDHDFVRARSGLLKRAGYFFTQALVPLESVRKAERANNRQLQNHNEVLRRLTAALTTGNRRLAREVARRRASELALKAGKAKFQVLFAQSLVMQKKLRQLTRQIITAQENERKEISRELHDEVVQTLVGINVELSALGKGASVGLRALKAKIARTQRLVENSVNAVHRFARELRPAVLDDLGLIPALHAYSKSLAERKKLKIRMTAFEGVEALGSAKRTVLFRVAQEALTNIARHAHATEVTMGITEVSGSIRMEISDNGRSFEVKNVLEGSRANRLGLIGMRERVEMVGGHLEIDSVAGRGTTVRAEIPCASTPPSR